MEYINNEKQNEGYDVEIKRFMDIIQMQSYSQIYWGNRTVIINYIFRLYKYRYYQCLNVIKYASDDIIIKEYYLILQNIKENVLNLLSFFRNKTTKMQEKMRECVRTYAKP